MTTATHSTNGHKPKERVPMIPAEKMPPSVIESGLLNALRTPDDLAAAESARITLDGFAVWAATYKFIREHVATYGSLPTRHQIAAQWQEWEPPDGELGYWISEFSEICIYDFTTHNGPDVRQV